MRVAFYPNNLNTARKLQIPAELKPFKANKKQKDQATTSLRTSAPHYMNFAAIMQ